MRSRNPLSTTKPSTATLDSRQHGWSATPASSRHAKTDRRGDESHLISFAYDGCEVIENAPTSPFFEMDPKDKPSVHPRDEYQPQKLNALAGCNNEDSKQ